MQQYRPTQEQVNKYMAVLKFHRAQEAELQYLQEVKLTNEKKLQFYNRIQTIKEKIIKKELDPVKATKMIGIVGKLAADLNKVPTFIEKREQLTSKYADLIFFMLRRQMRIKTKEPTDQVFFSISWDDDPGCKNATLMLYVFHKNKTITFYESFMFGEFLDKAEKHAHVPLKAYCQYSCDDLFAKLGEDHKAIVEGTIDKLYNKLGYVNES